MTDFELADQILINVLTEKSYKGSHLIAEELAVTELQVIQAVNLIKSHYNHYILRKIVGGRHSYHFYIDPKIREEVTDFVKNGGFSMIEKNAIQKNVEALKISKLYAENLAETTLYAKRARSQSDLSLLIAFSALIVAVIALFTKTN